MKSSSFSPSIASRSMKHMIQSAMSFTPRPEDLSAKELMNDINELSITNHTLFLENEIYERFLTRMEPELIENLENDMNTMINREQRARKVASVLLNTQKMSSMSTISVIKSPRSTVTVTPPNMVSFDVTVPEQRSTRTAIGSPSVVLSTVGSCFDKDVVKLGVQEKIDMATREMEELKREFKKFATHANLTKALKIARIAELQLTKVEVKKTRAEFVSRIVVNGVEKLTGRIPAERFVRFMEKWLNSAEFDAGKLRLQATTLRAINTRFKTLLKEKTERGDTLKPIDFERLKLDKEINKKKLDQLNYSCHTVKMHMSKAIYQVAQYKIELLAKDRELETLNNQIEHRNKRIKKLMQQVEHVQLEIIVARERLENLRDKMSRYTVPDVLSYIKLKAEIRTLEKKTKSWKRKIFVQHQCLRSTAAKLRKVSTKEEMPDYFGVTPSQECGEEEVETKEISGSTSLDDLYGLKSKMTLDSRDGLEDENLSSPSEKDAVEEKYEQGTNNTEVLEMFCNKSLFSLRNVSSTNILNEYLLNSIPKEMDDVQEGEGMVTSVSKEIGSTKTEEGTVKSSKELVDSNKEEGEMKSLSELFVDSNLEEGMVKSSKEVVDSNLEEGMITSLSKEVVDSNKEQGVVKSVSNEVVDSNKEEGVVKSVSKEVVDSNKEEGVVKLVSKEVVDSNKEEGVVKSVSKEVVDSNKEEGVVKSVSKEVVDSNKEEGVVKSVSKEVVASSKKESVVKLVSKVMVDSNLEEGVVKSLSKEVVDTNVEESIVTPLSN